MFTSTTYILINLVLTVIAMAVNYVRVLFNLYKSQDYLTLRNIIDPEPFNGGETGFLDVLGGILGNLTIICVGSMVALPVLGVTIIYAIYLGINSLIEYLNRQFNTVNVLDTKILINTKKLTIEELEK